MATLTHLSLVNLTLILLVLTATAYDVYTRHVPNWLMGTGLVSALVTQGMAVGVGAGCLAQLDGTTVSIGLCFGFFVLGGMGAGDVKLIDAIGVFMGPLGAFYVALVDFLADGVLMLVMVLLRREARRSATGVSALLLSIPFGSRAVYAEEQGSKHDETIRLPCAVAFTAGALLVE